MRSFDTLTFAIGLSGTDSGLASTGDENGTASIARLPQYAFEKTRHLQTSGPYFSVPYLDHLGLSCSAFQWAPKVLYVYATASCNRVIGSLSRVDFPAQGLGYSRVSPEACAKNVNTRNTAARSRNCSRFHIVDSLISSMQLTRLSFIVIGRKPSLFP